MKPLPVDRVQKVLREKTVLFAHQNRLYLQASVQLLTFGPNNVSTKKGGLTLPMELWVKVIAHAAAGEEDGLDKYKGYIEVEGLGVARLSFHDEKHTETARNEGEDGDQNDKGSISFLRCQPIVITNPMEVRKVRTHHDLRKRIL